MKVHLIGGTRFARSPEADQVLICSPDKDFGQCVTGDRVVLWAAVLAEGDGVDTEK